MPVFCLSTIFMKTKELNCSLHDVYEKKQVIENRGRRVGWRVMSETGQSPTSEVQSLTKLVLSGVWRLMKRGECECRRVGRQALGVLARSDAAIPPDSGSAVICGGTPIMAVTVHGLDTPATSKCRHYPISLVLTFGAASISIGETEWTSIYLPRLPTGGILPNPASRTLFEMEACFTLQTL
jgi:hypothetical protein